MATTALRRSSPEAEVVMQAEASEAAWRWLYRAGGGAALLLAALTVAHSGVFAVAGLPGTVAEWFALFQRNALLGLLAFELLMVLYVVASIPVVIALSAALGRREPALMAIYAMLSLVGIAAFIAARPAFEMLALSDGHAAATTEAQRALYLAAGEATLAAFNGTAFWVSYLLGSAGGLVLAVAMLRVGTFGRTIPALRIGSSLLDLGLFLPVVGLYVSLGSVLCLLAFNLLLARRFLRREMGSGG